MTSSKVYPGDGAVVVASPPHHTTCGIADVLTTSSPEKIAGGGAGSPADDGDAVVTLTVWRKSLLFSCNGFTVFDGRGNLAFRVDNYGGGNKGKVLLMDADGVPLLTVCRKRSTLGEIWLAYQGEKPSKHPIFSVRRHVTFLNSKTLAHVINAATTTSTTTTANVVVFEVQGSYAQRSVAVLDSQKRCVVEMRRKEAEAAAGGVVLGADVFRLIVRRSHVDTRLAMGILIVIDQMFGSFRRLWP